MKKVFTTCMLLGLLFSGAALAQGGKGDIKGSTPSTGKQEIKTPTPAPPVPPRPNPTPAPQAPPAAVMDESKTYIIVSKASGLVLDVAGASKADMAPINQYPKHSNANQQWKFQSAGGGYYYILNVNSGKVMDINGASREAGAKLIQYTKTATSAHQKFKIVKSGDAYQILASHSNMALDVPGATNESIQIQQYPTHGNSNQLWKLETFVPAPQPAPQPTPPASWIDGPIFLKESNMGITVYWQQITNNTNIILHEGLNNWVMLPNGGIVLKDNQRLGLTVLNQNKVNGERIILHEGYNQWSVLSNGAIVLKDNPRMGITVLNQNRVNEAQLILHEGYNTWTNVNEICDNLEFNARFYADTYNDLKAAFGYDCLKLKNHWEVHGKKEGRQTASSFSIQAYLARYEDLRNAFGAQNYEAAWKHWYDHGKREGRNPAP